MLVYQLVSLLLHLPSDLVQLVLMFLIYVVIDLLVLVGNSRRLLLRQLFLVNYLFQLDDVFLVVLQLLQQLVYLLVQHLYLLIVALYLLFFGLDDFLFDF